ncbi:hypothetical protein V6N12_015188 [Hibiscus sabdariffa]|uniref:Uncharacterized protein n=1 Tax=Hibiscus sabdariffa TaxID=183260 RepID=A0ABR2DMF1_9ROSI
MRFPSSLMKLFLSNEKQPPYQTISFRCHVLSNLDFPYHSQSLSPRKDIVLSLRTPSILIFHTPGLDILV